MAKFISDENIRLNIIVNGNPAQKELLDLEKATKALNRTQKDLRSEKARLIAAGKQETKEYKNVTAEIKKNNATLKENKARLEALQKEIGVTGLTMAQLKKRASVLRLALSHAIPGGEDEKRYRKELTAIGARLDALKLKSKQTKLSLSSIANGFNKYAALGASVIATTTGIVLGLQQMIDYNGKLADAQSDVQKTTGLTKKEVDELTKSFGVFNTRTSRMDLLKIAEEGGRIGIAKNEIQDFVRVMNKANVALGDSFKGGPEEVASKLGKLKLLFKETKDIGVEDAYEAIGSAINELGANGVATETNIASFATRIGSLPDALKPTIQDALGLGAAFEESGVQAEISGRAYAIFLGEAAKNSDKFAEVMGITTAEVENLINSNPTEFFLQFSESLAETSEGGVDTAKTMAKLGLSADGVKKIVGAAGNNVGRFRELLDLSNKSMISASSLTNEYNIKNNNLAATLSKVQKKLMGAFSSETVINGLTSFVTWFGKLIGAVEDTDGAVTKWKAKLLNAIKIVAVLIAGLVSYNGALKLVALYQNGLTSSTYLLTIAQKANALTGGLLKAAVSLLQFVYYGLTLQTKKATIAQNSLNLAMKMNPIGLVIALITAATTAYFLYSKEIDTATKNQRTLNSLRVGAKKQIQDEITELNNLLTIARDVTQSKENRLKAIKKINEISPQYLKNITLEKINTLEAKGAIDQYILSLEKKAMAEAFAQKRTEVNKKLLDASSNEEKRYYGGFFQGSETDFKDFYEKEEKNIEEFKKLTNGWNTYKFNAYRDYKKGIQDAKDELQFLQEEEKKFIKLNASLYVDTGGGNEPKEGDQKFIGEGLFIFQGGKWVYQKPTGGGPGGSTITPEEQAIIDSKARIAQFLKDWNAEQDLQKELKDLSDEEAEILRLEKKYEKMAFDAGFETLEAAGLEDIKNKEIQAVKDKWADIRLKKKEDEDAEYEKLEAKHKKALLKAEEELQQAKINAKNQGLNALQSLFGRESAIAKLAFGIQKALAIQEILINTKKANAQIISNLAIANMKAVARNPLMGGLPWTGINTAIAVKHKLANNLNAGAQIAGILATSIQGFEEGFYPVQREQDGKMFNAQFGGQTRSGMVNKPTMFLAGENGPELIVDSKAFRQINPDIRSSFQREIARVKGFEVGYYPQPTNTNIAPQTTDISSGDTSMNLLLSEAIQVIRENKEMMQSLKDKGITAYMSNDLKNGKLMQETIDDYNTLRNKNKR